MNIDDSARQMFEQEQNTEALRANLRKNLPIILALASHDESRPINNPSLIAAAKACAVVIAIPMMPPPPKQE